MEWLNFGKHLATVQSFFPMQHLSWFKEYIDAMNMFKSDSSEYENDACILGQPGIVPLGCSHMIQGFLIMSCREVPFHRASWLEVCTYKGSQHVNTTAITYQKKRQSRGGETHRLRFPNNPECLSQYPPFCFSSRAPHQPVKVGLRPASPNLRFE
jgi:hypothetical protein